MYALRTLFERDLSIAKSSFKALNILTPINPPSDAILSKKLVDDYGSFAEVFCALSLNSSDFAA